jgi:hypothetical protein
MKKGRGYALALFVCVSLLCLWAGFLFLTPLASSQASYCDPLAEPSSDSTYPYAPLADRCEGEVARLVASRRLELISLTDNVQNAPLEENFQVTWDAREVTSVSAEASVHLRVRSTGCDCLYQMDTLTSANDFHWSSEIASNVGVGSVTDLGVTAYLMGLKEIYLPVRFGTQALSPGDAYTFTILPGSDLEEVFISLVHITDKGEPLGVIVSEEKYDEKVQRWPPLEIALDKALFPEPGLYELTVTARVLGVLESPTNSFWFVHTGR